MMKKTILFILLFIFAPVIVKSVSHEKLIYGVEDVQIDSTKITIKGWAYIDRIHSIGGRNYNISVSAVRKSSVVNATDYVSSGNKLTVNASGDSYSNYNELYPFTCKRDGDGECWQVYYGYYNDRNDDGVTDDEDGNIVCTPGNGITCDGNKPKYATCTSNTSTSCIYYNTNFEVVFYLDELEQKFGSDEITFIINATYSEIDEIFLEDSSKDCYFVRNNYGGGSYVGCYGNSPSTTLKQFLTFSEKVISSGDYGSRLDQMMISNTGQFKIRAIGAYQLDSYGSKKEPHISFINGSLHTIENFVRGKIVDSGGTALESSSIGLYKMSGEYYAWSAWGNISGQVVIRLPVKGDIPSASCSNYSTPAAACSSEIKFENKDCQQVLSYVSAPTDALNYDDCGNTDGAGYGIKQIYTFDEINKFMPDDSSVFGLTYNPGRAVELGFSFVRDLDYKVGKWKNGVLKDNAQYYYFVSYYYREPSTNQCTLKSDYYVTEEYLRNRLGDTPIDLMKINAKYVFLEQIKNIIKNNQNQKITYEYKNPNDYNENAAVSSSFNYYKDPDPLIGSYDAYINIIGNISSRSFDFTYKYDLKNAYLRNGVDGLDSNGKLEIFRTVTYKDKSSDSEYIDGGNNYYIPFNTPIGTNILRFKTSIKDSSLLLDDITLTHDCSVDIEGGKLENLRYRVIALDNPFPNHVSGRYPTLNGYASNWYGLWSDTYKFNTVNNMDWLHERYLDNNVEMYSAELFPNNISLLRKYNSTSIFTYFNPNILNKSNGSYSDIIENGIDGVKFINRSGNITKFKYGIGKVS